jgi:hypothetical protein
MEQVLNSGRQHGVAALQLKQHKARDWQEQHQSKLTLYVKSIRSDMLHFEKRHSLWKIDPDSKSLSPQVPLWKVPAASIFA